MSHLTNKYQSPKEQGITDGSVDENTLPLLGVEVVVTRATHQQQKACESLRALGATTISAPLIQLAPPPPSSDTCYQQDPWLIPIFEAGVQFHQFDWIIFTSVNAVHHTNQAWLEWGGIDGLLTRQVQNQSPHLLPKNFQVRPQVICVGKSTQDAFTSYTCYPSLIPEQFHAEGVLKLLSSFSIDEQHILLPRALKARDLLPKVLRERGAKVLVAPVYQTLSAQLTPQLKERVIHANHELFYLTFTSSSTVSSFVEQLSTDELQALKARIIVIGPIVEQRAMGLKLKVSQVAEPHTWHGLIQAIITDKNDKIHSACTSETIKK